MENKTMKTICPRCGGMEFHTQQRGFSFWTGAIGSRTVYRTCLNCGKRLKVGQNYQKNCRKNLNKDYQPTVEKHSAKVFFKVLGVIFIFAVLGAFVGGGF